MANCPKCFKPNPDDAVFCGFCGGKITVPAEEGKPAKTVFGYTFDADKAGAHAAQEPGTSPPAQEQAKAKPAEPAQQAPPPEATTPYPSGQGLIAGKYWLGEGGKRLPAGELLPAKDVNQQGSLQVMLVDKAVFQSPLDMERARRELRQLQKVESSGIVRVLDHGKGEDDRLYIAMEAVTGSPLDELINKAPMSLAETQRVVKGVGTGLAEAQKMGVIHRDIAPHNIIVCDDGAVKVRGFGVAAPIKRHVLGTPAFISPEQASGRPVDQRSNIYSLGALMFYMLTGEPPFVAGSVDEVLEKHQKEDPVSPKVRRPDLELPARAEALILKALAKSSSRRHLTLRQFLREVDSLAVVTGPMDSVKEEPKALSFETPLHGVTTLKGGQEPPPSEPRVPASTQPGSAPLHLDSASPTLNEVSEAPANSTPTLQDPPVSAPAPAPAAVAPAPAPVVPAPAAAKPAATAPQAAPSPPPAATLDELKRKSQITGEVSSDIQLKKPSGPAAPASAPKTKTSGPAQPVAQGAPAMPPDGRQGKGKFRETMWFFKGEVESAMAEEGSEEVAKPPEGDEVSPEELAAKYADDGSIDANAEARRLSLRTGRTQMMQKANVPRGNLPGQKMADKELIGEISNTPRYIIWVGLAVVLAGIGGLVAYLVLN